VSLKTVADSMRRQGLVARRIRRRNPLTRQDKSVAGSHDRPQQRRGGEHQASHQIKALLVTAEQEMRDQLRVQSLLQLATRASELTYSGG